MAVPQGAARVARTMSSSPPTTEAEKVVRPGTVPGEVPEAAAADRRRNFLHAVVVAIRPGEWIKNLFVLGPLVFSGLFDEADQVVAALVTFGAFCAMASAGYLLNDLLDRELDRQHPVKSLRPIASGDLPVGAAGAIAVLLVPLALGAGFAVAWDVAAMVAAYGVLTAAYSLGLKHVVIVDVMSIAALFLIRVLAGAIAIDVTASSWLLLCTGMLALLLGFGKRRQEAVAEETSNGARPVLEHYSEPFLDQMMALVTAGTIISYAIYAMESPIVGEKMIATTPPVLYGIFRYLYLIYHRRDTRSTATLVARDPGIVAAIAVWAITAVILLST